MKDERRQLQDVRNGEPAGKNPQLAGLVLALMGPFTYGTTRPFAFLLCLEWIRNPARPPILRYLDWVGLVLSVPGCLVLPVVLYGMATYDLIGPTPVVIYVGVLAWWVWWRVSGWADDSPPRLLNRRADPPAVAVAPPEELAMVCPPR